MHYQPDEHRIPPSKGGMHYRGSAPHAECDVSGIQCTPRHSNGGVSFLLPNLCGTVNYWLNDSTQPSRDPSNPGQATYAARAPAFTFANASLDCTPFRYTMVDLMSRWPIHV